MQSCRSWILAALGLVFGLGGGSAAWAAERPNIVFVLTDDQRFDALGCMGNPIFKTPVIDRLAADGVKFTNMFCTTSICAISRASFITGQYERRHGINGFRTPLTARQWKQTFPAQLRAAGYRTGIIGKWGLGGAMPKDEYDDFKGYPGQGRYYPKGQSKQAGVHLTEKLAGQALEFLDGCTRGQPFMLQLYTKAAHCQDGDPWPFQPDVKYDPMYRDVTISKAKTFTDRHFQELPKFLQTSEARNRWKIRFANEELFQKSVKDYYRLVAGIDETVGKILARLEEKNLAKNTVIIYTSDNGFYLGEHGLAGKWFMHEESIRLPLIIHDPRLPQKLRGQVKDQIVLNIDIAPTICDLAGVKVPAAMQGKSLVPLLKGENPEWRQDFLYEHRFAHKAIPQTEGVRNRRWKYTRYTSVEPVYEELFDLKTDPLEEHNLAGDPKYADQLILQRKVRSCISG